MQKAHQTCVTVIQRVIATMYNQQQWYAQHRVWRINVEMWHNK